MCRTPRSQLEDLAAAHPIQGTPSDRGARCPLVCGRVVTQALTARALDWRVVVFNDVPMSSKWLCITPTGVTLGVRL